MHRSVALIGLVGALALCVACRDEEPAPTPPADDSPPTSLPPPPLMPADAPAPGAAEPRPAPPAVPANPQAGALEIEVALPRGEVNGLVRPTITFNKPVKALGAGDDASPPAIIEPAIDGAWRWLGSSTVEFVPRKPAPLSTAFTVRVPAGLTALDGGTLAAEYRYDFSTSRPRPVTGTPLNAWNSYKLVRADQAFEVTFDQPLEPGSLAKGLVIRGPGADSPVTILGTEPLAEDEADAARDRRVKVRFKPSGPLALDAEHELVFTPALRGTSGPLGPSEEVAWAFRTYPPLAIKSAGCKSWYGKCPDGPITIEFSTPIKASALRKALALEPAVELQWPEDGDAERQTWTLFGAFRPASTYAITLTGLTDIFGQSLPEYRGQMVSGDYSPSLEANHDEALLERGLRAALPLVHVNMSRYSLGFARLTPAEAIPWLVKPWRKEAPPHMAWADRSIGGDRNARLRSPLDLDALFAADTGERAGQIGLVRMKWKEGKYNHKSSTMVQVTNIGVHFKSSPVDTAIWAWDLADGEPVGGAEVSLLDAEGRTLATGRTEADGIARLPGVDALDLPKKNKWGGRLYGPPFIAAVVTSGDDVGISTTRETWSFAPYRYGLSGAWENSPPQAEGLVFTERGIYRPGETIYLKGILRERRLGELETPAGRSVELVVTDPQGGEVARTTHTLSKFGGFHASIEVPADGRLGTWSFSVADAANDLNWSTTARVAEYRPPAFLVEVQPTAEARYAGEPVEAAVEGRYLFGAAMNGAELSWSMAAAPGRFEPKDGDGYVFGRRFNWWDDEDTSATVLAGGNWSLDDEGRFTVKAGPAKTPKNRPQMYTVEARVTDVDRQQVAGRATFPVHPADHYVGLKGPSGFAEAGQPFEVSVVARAATDEARVAAAGVTVKLMRHQWNTVKKKNAWGAFETISEKEEVEVQSCTVDAPLTGAGACTFTAPKSGYHELVAESKDRAGRATATTDGVWVGGPGYAAWMQDDDNKVDVIAEKGTYDVGETARLLVQSPFPEAEAWVTVERAGILSHQRVRLQGTATPISIPITEDMIPNAFVGVVLARGRIDAPGKPGDPGRPTFRVGYRELRVVKASKRLAVELKPDSAEKRPGDELAIAVSVRDHQGQGVETEVAVWAVDEGVLSLTGYTAPDPVEALHRPRGLSVRQSTNLSALVAQLNYGEKGRNAGGGGGSADAMEVRSRFVTTPIFIGDATTGPDGKTTVKGKLPDNLTTFRLMAVAVSAGDQGGKGRSEVLVTKPLLARPALPRTARVGDRFTAGAVLHLREGEHADVTVKASVEGPVEAIGGLERTLRVPAGKGVEVRFGFEAKAAGAAKLQFAVSGGGYEDAVRTTIPITLPARLETVATYGDTDGVRTEALAIPGAIRKDMGGLELSLASTALAGLGDAAEMLIEYPYGCLEQRSSRLVPFVALKSLLDRFGEQWLGEREPEAVVAETVEALARLQRPDGGFGYWPGARRSHYWGTAYATLALGEAATAGYPLTGVDLAAARTYLRERFSSPVGYGNRLPTRESRALALYVLARHGQPERGLEQNLYGERDKMALFGRALLASAMAGTLAGEKRAKVLVEGIMNAARVDADTVHFAEDNPDTYAPLFHSDTRTTAIVLQALLALDPQHAFVPKIARYLQTVRTGGGYRTTQEAAFSLMAMADFAKAREAAVPDFVARVKLGDKELFSAPFKGRDAGSVTHAMAIDALGGAGAPKQMTFAADGAGRLYYGARLRVAPVELPTDARDDGITVQRWYTIDGGADDPVKAVNEGATVRVHLRMATHQLRHYVAIEDPLPAGLEPVDTSLATTGTLGPPAAEGSGDSSGSDGLDGAEMPWWYSPFEHTEMRDDRVLLFADRLPPGVHTYSYLARATTAGVFVRPPVRAEEMYTPEVSGRSTGGFFWVHPRAELSQR